MLSPKPLDLLRDWHRIAWPAVWLFPGRDPMLPMTTRSWAMHYRPDFFLLDLVVALRLSDIAQIVITPIDKKSGRR